ncbi:MAG: type IV pili methyl-accepting chemotaxis transducer N-terminal domain-containing protein [Rhodospirillales bacterium]|nr:type IV pili methyl-accepting chemotaxis transducer N-terminal domain-containing protein [Alphaproteobacteria bacterium]MCB9977491.1 type IV pili methyl-accepting chemotaxis transducer N-terminal domain-containing protein [Rhodospirillales bacterium]
MYNFSRAEHDARIINISGMQRMLSQRVALMVTKIAENPNNQKTQPYLEKLEGAQTRMRQNHEELKSRIISESQNSDLYQLYFEDDGIDSQMQHYLGLASDFLKLYKAGDYNAEKAGSLSNEITFIAADGFLQKLDRAVSLYEKQAPGNLQNLRTYEIYFFVLGVLVLISEVLLIFRPMVREIVNKTETLSNRNKELTEFSYRISHDLRAPIRSVLGLVGIMEKANEKGDREKADEAFRKIKPALMNFERLVEDIIKLNKMSVADIPEEEVFIPAVIDESVKAVENILANDKVQIVVNTDIQHSCVMQKLLLRQILENLISNAIKYYDPEKEVSKLEISAHERDKKYIISIIDNGLGIPEDFRHKLFQMFQHFHPQKSFGSGLGLYLVKQSVKALKGDIRYVPRPDGSEFILTFPGKNI